MEVTILHMKFPKLRVLARHSLTQVVSHDVSINALVNTKSWPSEIIQS